MTQLPASIPDMHSGRDKRLLLKHEDDQLDLQLYAWGLNQGVYSYHESLGQALKWWLTNYLQNSRQYQWATERLQTIRRQELCEFSLNVLSGLPLPQLGFPAPAVKYALRHAVSLFLKKQGVRLD